MDELFKKLEQLEDLLKAVKAMSKPSTPSMPQLPGLKPPGTPPMTSSAAAAPKISHGQGPNSKKDPKKIAQQIKDGSMSTKTQKVMLKADSVTGQWYLEPTDGSDI